VGCQDRLGTLEVGIAREDQPPMSLGRPHIRPLQGLETGVDPVLLTEYAVILSVVALPMTYLPVLLIARDRTFMGRHTNGILANALGWLYFAILLLVALAAIPLMLITDGGAS